jgi:PAS domain S-box-containing protein
LYGTGAYTTMAFHTAFLLSLLAIGVLCSRPAVGVTALIISPDAEGTVARRSLVAGIAILTLLGWLPRIGEGAGLYDGTFGVALTVMGTIIVLSIVIVASARSVRRLRTISESALREANDSLQFMVERKTRELGHREEEFRLVVEEAPNAFVATDSHGRIAAVNQKTEEMFGWARDKLIGCNVSDTLVPERYREACRGGLQGFVTGGDSRFFDRPVHIEALHRDGHEFPVEVTAAAVWFDDEWRFNAFIRDLTQIKEAQIRLKAALSEKEALLKEVHHRVKNNLQVISSFLRLQASGLQDPAAIEALRESDERVMSMALLHETLYHSESLGRVDFDRYLRALRTELLRTYTGDDGRLTIATESQLPDLDIETAVPLGLLVNELLTNALKHAFPNGGTGHVSVQVSVESDKGRLSVRDDGVGFTRRADGSTVSMGLGIIDALSRQLGGRGGFRHDGGTEFTLEFFLHGQGRRG